MLKASLIVVCSMVVGALACDATSQSIETKNQQLTSAAEKLRKNPQDEQALSVILKMLSDKDTVARGNAADFLGGLWEEIGGLMHHKAIPALIEALEKDNVFVKKAAACALRKFGPLAKDAIPVLRKVLSPSDSDVAWCAAKALGAMGELARDAVPDLLRVVKDDETHYSYDRTSISKFALQALGEIGVAAKEVVPDLVSLLDHPSPYFVMSTSVALIRIDPGNAKAVGQLEVLLKDQDVEIRRQTIWMLRDIGAEARPVKKLIEAATRDKDGDVSIAALKLLKAIG